MRNVYQISIFSLGLLFLASCGVHQQSVLPTASPEPSTTQYIAEARPPQSPVNTRSFQAPDVPMADLATSFRMNETIPEKSLNPKFSDLGLVHQGKTFPVPPARPMKVLYSTAWNDVKAAKSETNLGLLCNNKFYPAPAISTYRSPVNMQSSCLQKGLYSTESMLCKRIYTTNTLLAKEQIIKESAVFLRSVARCNKTPLVLVIAVGAGLLIEYYIEQKQ